MFAVHSFLYMNISAYKRTAMLNMAYARRDKYALTLTAMDWAAMVLVDQNNVEKPIYPQEQMSRVKALIALVEEKPNELITLSYEQLNALFDAGMEGRLDQQTNLQLALLFLERYNKSQWNELLRFTPEQLEKICEEH